MENQVTYLAQILITIVPFLVLVLCFWGYVFYRKTVKAYRENLGTSGRKLRSLERRLQFIQSQVYLFSSEEPEPYGSLLNKMNHSILESETSLLLLKNLYAQMQDQFSKLTHLKWINALSFPTLARGINSINTNFETKSFALNQQLDRLYELNTRLKDIGWDTAKSVKQLLGKIQENIVIIDEIQNAGMGDDQLTSILKKLNTWETTLVSQIPAIFFLDDKALFDEKSERNLIVTVHKTLKPALQDATPLIQKVIEWKEDLERFYSMADTLARKNDEITRSLRQLHEDPSLPVEWDESKQAVEKLVETFRLEQKTVRKISELSSDNRRLYSLQTLQKRLCNHINSVVKAHQELRQLGDKEIINKALAWSKGAVKAMDNAKKYHNDNWHGVIAFDRLYNDLNLLVAQYEQIFPIIAGGKILETQVGSAHMLFAEATSSYKEVLPLFNSFQKKYQVILQLERDGKEICLALRSTMNQIQSVVESNPLLKQRFSKSLERMINEVPRIESAFEHPEHSIVENKYKKLENFIVRAENSLKKWIGLMDGEIQNKRTVLSGTVSKLQDMVIISDPIYAEILSLVKEEKDQFRSTGGNFPNQPLLPIALELRNKSEYWQKLTASTQTLEEISGPIMNEFNKLEKNRGKLSEQMVLADRIIPEKLSWPPTTQRLSLERVEYKKLEGQFISFKNTRYKAIQLVSIISDLSDRYRELSVSVTRILDLAEQEKKRFSDLEKRLHQSKKLWNDRLAENQNNIILEDELEKLLQSNDEDFVELQKRYMNGSIAYQQTYQMLRILCRKLDEASVQIGVKEYVDITGQVHRQI